MSGDLSAQEIRSYFDRWKRIEDAADGLRGYDERVEYVIDRLVPFRDYRTYGTDRALVAGGRMFGVGRRQMRRMIKSHALKSGRLTHIRHYSSKEEERQKAAAMSAVPDVTEFCGYVYTARLVHYPHILKIGFTMDPGRRERELCTAAKTKVEMESVDVGTLFDEAYLLLVNGRQQIHTEWFFDAELPINSMPEFLNNGVHVEGWRKAAARSQAGGGRNAIGTLGHIYLSAICRAEAA